MGSDFKLETAVQCPFFVIAKAAQGATGYGITCEGIDTAQFNTTRFDSKLKREKFMERNCMNYPNNCPIAEAINLKYK